MDRVDPRGRREGAFPGEPGWETLRAELDLQAQRLARIEEHLGLNRPVVEEPDRGPQPAATTGARLLAQFAWGCFALGGALVLRSITHQGWVAPPLGTGLGIVYGLGLILFPALLLRSATSRSTTAAALHLCGLAVVALIVNEMVRRGGSGLGVSAAAAALAAMTGLGLWAGVRQQRTGLVLATVMAATLAVAALGLTLEGVVLRAGLLGALAALALWCSRRLAAPWLRPVALIPIALILSVAVVITGQRESVPRWVPLTLLAAVSAVALLQLTFALARARPDRWERVSGPLGLLWATLLALFSAPAEATVVTVGLGAALLASASSLSTGRARIFLFSGGLLLAAGLAGSWTAAPFLALAALFTQHLRALSGDRAGALLSLGLLLLGNGSIALALLRGAASWPLLGLGLLSALLAVLHAARAAGSAERAPRRLAPLSLFAALCPVLVISAATAQHAGPHAGQLAGSIALAAASVLCRLADPRLPGAAGVGLVVLGALALKVLLQDLSSLDGLFRIAAVVSLGLTALASSLIRRGPGPREEAPADG